MYTNYAESRKRLDGRLAPNRAPDSPEHLLEAAARQLARLIHRADMGKGIDDTDVGLVVQNIFEAAVVEAYQRLYLDIDRLGVAADRIEEAL